MGDPIVMQLVSRVLDSGCTPEDACCDSPSLLAEVRERAVWNDADALSARAKSIH